MAEPKTRQTLASVADFIDALPSETQRDDARAICIIMKSISGKPPRMWGTSIIGFDTYPYVYASGREADWPVLAFSPRKKNLTIDLMPGFKDHKTYLENLGKFKISGSCLHFTSLNNLHQPTLKSLLKASHTYIKKYVAAKKK